MGNLITNSGLLDGLDGWTTVSGGQAAQVDAGVYYGAKGRAVIYSEGVATADTQIVALTAAAGDYAAVTAGLTYEMFAAGYFSRGAPQLVINWRKADLTIVQTDAFAALPGAPTSAPEQGVERTFSRFYATPVAPALATLAEVRLRGTVPLNGQGFKLSLRRPYLGIYGARQARWDPGLHANADWNLPIWPDRMPWFIGSSGVSPFDNRSGFTGSDGVPAGRVLYVRPQVDFRGRMRLSEVEAGILDDFHAEAHRRFYVVEPTSDRLCVASWLPDGAPKVIQPRGPSRLVEVGLKLRAI